MVQAQYATQTLKIQKIMIKPAFLRGYDEASRGLPFSKDYDKMNGQEQWGYERGRHFYFAAGKIKLKRGRGISSYAVDKWVELKEANAII